MAWATPLAPQFHDPYSGEYVTPRTQKATGVLVLRSDSWNVPQVMLAQNVSMIRVAWNHLQRRNNRYGINDVPLFARPCPVRPRHGFVDSVVVKTFQEAVAVFEKAVAADPEAELLLMPLIEADLSAIWVPGRLVIGPGRDGATSGHKSITIPLVNSGTMSDYMADIAHRANVKKGEVPYIEVVARKVDQNPYYVQVRGGPPIVGSGLDFIPRSMVVKHVVRATGDLLEWEAKTKKFDADTVVWHPGGSMASHYAVHCVLNSIPIIITRRPRIGDQLQPTATKEPVTMQSVINGIGAGMALDLANKENRHPAVAAMLVGLHNLSAFSGNDGFWLGAGAAIMHRFGTAAMIGEARHAGNRSGMSREGIYDVMLKEPFRARRRIKRSQFMFENYKWSGSYGGPAWASCGNALLDLDIAIREFMLDPIESNYKDLGDKLNMAVNQAHNGGWWLNKFTGTDMMDQAANGDPRAAVAGIVALYALSQTKVKAIEESVQYWRATRAIGEIPSADQPLVKYPKPVSYPVNKTNKYPSSITSKENLPADWTIFDDAEKLQPVVEEPQPTPLNPFSPMHSVFQAQAVIKGNEYIHIQYRWPDMPKGKYETVDVQITEEMQAKHNSNCLKKNLADCLKTSGAFTSMAVTSTVYNAMYSFSKPDGSKAIAMPWCGHPITSVQKA